MAGKGNGEPLKVITVCGVGMGSSLILRMTAEEAFRDLGVPAKVEATDVSTARSISADVIIGQGMHTEEFQGAAPIVVAISDFTDSGALRQKLAGPLREQGWLDE